MLYNTSPKKEYRQNKNKKQSRNNFFRMRVDKHHRLYSKSNLHIEEISYKSGHNSWKSTSPNIVKCKKMNHSICNNQNSKERIKCYGHKSDISMLEMSIGLKGIFPIGKKCNHRLYNKRYTRGKEIMHAHKLNKSPHHKEVEDEHDSTYSDISYELYETFMLMRKMEEKLRHHSNLRS